ASLHADKQGKEGKTFDQSGGNNHGGLDRAGYLGLPSHALQGSGGESADPHGGTNGDDTGTKGSTQVQQGAANRRVLGDRGSSQDDEKQDSEQRQFGKRAHGLLLL